jgi:hypothetical protein
MLRVWEERVQDAGTGILRFSLEDPSTGKRHGFPNLRALNKFLRQLVGQNIVHRP